MLEFALALSIHAGLEGNYNSFHPYIKYSNDLFIAGAYYNSESNVSFFAGAEFDLTENIWLEVGAVTGYSYTPVAPFARIGYDFNDNFSVFAAPAAEYDQSGDLHYGAVLGIEYKF